jgi:hypothetical protein
MYNCHESNLSNNPGAVKAIFRCSVKYAEQVQYSMKTCITVMLCSLAAGIMLPPYVVYKSGNLYDNWCMGGPKNAVYMNSQSGWFDRYI